jgi:hypothetical protein
VACSVPLRHTQEVDSATPSITPTVNALAPNVVTMNTGSRLWTNSDDRSMNRLTKPNVQIVRGMPERSAPVRGLSLLIFSSCTHGYEGKTENDSVPPLAMTTEPAITLTQSHPPGRRRLHRRQGSFKPGAREHGAYMVRPGSLAVHGLSTACGPLPSPVRKVGSAAEFT